MAEGLCISADSHVVEPPEVFHGLDKRFGESAPKIVRDPERGDVLDLGNGRLGISIGLFLIAGMDPGLPETQEMVRRGYSIARPGVSDPVERLKDQDLDGVIAEVIYPSVLFNVYSLPSPEIVHATFQNYNDWLANYCAEAPDRLFPLAAISLHDVDVAVAELERTRKMGHRGACIPCTAPSDRPYSDPSYEKFWAAAESMNVPLAMHVFTGASPNHGLPAWPRLGYTLAHVGIAITIGTLILSGVCARHPGLRFIPTEWETGWVAHFLRRLDWSFHRFPTQRVADLKLVPSDYFHQNFIVTFEDDELGIRTRDVIGVRNLMWGSDYPHGDSIFPESQRVLDVIFAGVPDEDRRRITAMNAIELYGLPFKA